jgi:hypothetical protein
MNKNQWILALLSQSVALGVIILFDFIWIWMAIYYEINQRRSVTLIFTVFIIFVVLPLSIRFTTMIHYECWKVLPSGYRNQITPEEAIGFLFIPFYNFYWFFISYPCLASGYYRCGQQNNISEIKNQRGLAITYAILSVCNIVFIFIPVLRSATYIAGFVIFLLFYKRMVSYANLVSNMQSKIDS